MQISQLYMNVHVSCLLNVATLHITLLPSLLLSTQVNDMDAKQRAILFGLCHFHAVMIERKKFGPKGFNMMYPFSLGDLRDSAVCLQVREFRAMSWGDNK